MKRILFLLVAALCCLGLAGCLQATAETEINDDGSGFFSLAYSMSPTVAEAMKELEELGGVQDMDADMPMFNDLDEGEFKKHCKQHGVTLEKFAQTNKDGREGFEIALRFKNLEGLNAAMKEGMGDGGGLRLSKTPDGDYVFKLVPDDGEDMAEDSMDMDESEEDPMSAPEEEFDPEKLGKAMEIMGKMMASISELEFNLRISVPGDIIESNAPTVEGRTSIWEIRGDDMMAAGPDMAEPRILFSGKGLDINAPELEE